MQDKNRRKFLESSAGVAAAATFGTGALWTPFAQAQSLAYKPEKGAKLRLLRWKRFVQGDEDALMANIKAFTDKTGIEVRVDSEGWEDVRPKAAVAANTGAGPDIILSTNDDANLYPEKLLDVTDVCTYLGAKYGGWYPVCEAYLRPNGKNWIGIPLGCAGNTLVYRESHVKAAGFSSFPRDTDGFLVKTHRLSRSRELEGNFRNVLSEIEAVFARQRTLLLEHDVDDLDIQIEVLRKQLEREGIT